MQILYIPYRENEAGDLPALAHSWKYTLEAISNTQITIVYHQNDIDAKLIDEVNELFILAHGAIHGMKTELYNNISNENPITPETLASRFLIDFTFLLPSIKDIHIYCCGEKLKNMHVMWRFQEALLNAEISDIHGYSGSIFGPNSFGRRISFFKDNWLPVEATQFTLFRKTCVVEDDLDLRRSLKSSALDKHITNGPSRRNKLLQTIRHENRQALFGKYRKAIKINELEDAMPIIDKPL